MRGFPVRIEVLYDQYGDMLTKGNTSLVVRLIGMSIHPLIRLHVVHNGELNTNISGPLGVSEHEVYLSEYIGEEFGGLHPENPIYTVEPQDQTVISTEKFEERDDNLAIVDALVESVRDFFPEATIRRQENRAPDRPGTTNRDSQELDYEIIIFIE